MIPARPENVRLDAVDGCDARGGRLGRPAWALPAIVAFGLLVRLPAWLVALRTPLDGDTSIVGLMAQSGRAAATFWGQPYGSPLDAWVAWPFVATLGPTALALRLPYLLLSLALIPLADALARRLHPAAGLPAAFVLACPPAYFVLLAALPPPLYPTTLALLAALLVGAFALEERLSGQARAPVAGLLAWGLGAGLAAWTHLLSAAVLVPAGVYLMWRAPGRRRAWLALALLGALAGSAPLLLRLVRDPAATAVVAVAGEGQDPWRHALELAPQMHRPLLGLIGARVPLTADDPQQGVGLSWGGTALLALLYATGLAAAVGAARRQPRAALLLACLGLVVAAFPFPLRSGPETLRFLTPAYVPLAALVVFAAAAGERPLRAWTVALSLSIWQLLPLTQLLAEWRKPGVVLVPDCGPARDVLVARGLRHAWASYNLAWCLSYTSGGRLLASQPWNERFPGQPLPYREQVRLAPRSAWVLMPGADFDLPTPERFAAWLAAGGGRARRSDLPGGAVVFDDFEAPFPDQAAPLPGGGPLGDGRLDTRRLEPAVGPLTLAVSPARPLAGLTLAAGPQPPGLPPGLVVEVSADGAVFERVARLRPGWRELTWAGGQPQPRDGLTLLGLPLAGRLVAALRVTPAPPAGPWGLAEVLLHEATPGPAAVSAGALWRGSPAGSR